MDFCRNDIKERKFSVVPKYFIEKIINECKQYLNYLNNFGNECAYTDRMIENIIHYTIQLAQTSGNIEFIKNSIIKEICDECSGRESVQG